MSNYKNKRAASAKIGKKLGAALSSAVLVAPAVMSAVPSVAWAATTTTVIGGTTYSYDADAVEHLTLTYTFSSATNTQFKSAVVTDGEITSLIAGGATENYSGMADYNAAWKKVNSGADGASDTEKEYAGVVSKTIAAANLTSAVATLNTGYTSTGWYADSAKANRLSSTLTLSELNGASTVYLDTSEGTTAASVDVATKVEIVSENTGTKADDGRAVAWIKETGSATNVTKTTLDKMENIHVDVEDGYHFTAWVNTTNQISYASQQNPVLSAADYATLLAKSTASPATFTFPLQALVEANEIKVTFDAGTYGTLAANTPEEKDDISYAGGWDLSTTVGNAQVKPTATVKATYAAQGYAFVGWALSDGTLVTDSTGSVENPGAITALTGKDKATVALHAVYAQTQDTSVTNGSDVIIVDAYAGTAGYTGTGNTTGGTVQLKDGTAAGASSSIKSVDGKITLVDAVAAAKDGYTFKGWYKVTSTTTTTTGATVKTIATTPSFTTPTLSVANIIASANQDDNTTTSTNKVIAETTYVAIFEKDDAKSFTVTYDANGGKVKAAGGRGIDPQKEALDGKKDTVSVSSNTDLNKIYVREGYVVATDGYVWNTKADGTGTKVNSTYDLEKLGKDGDFTLYLQWKQNDAWNKITFAVDGSGSVAVTDKDGKVFDGEIMVNAETMTTDYTATLTAGKGTVGGWTVSVADADAPTVATASLKVKGLTAAGLIDTADFTGTVLTPAIIRANIAALDASVTVTGGAINTSKAQIITFTANVKAWTYSVTIDGKTSYDFTVGADAALPSGDLYYGSTKIESQADLDKLVTKDHDSIALTTKSTAKKAGWYKDSDGDYHYAKSIDEDGDYVDALGWSRGGTTKYYYYFDKTTGKMKKNAWVKDGYWYHFGARGAMEHDRDIDYKGVTYHLNTRGAAVKKA